MRVFGVDYQFLSCGSVFTDGLAHASAGIEYAHSGWDAPDLGDQIAAFAPDLIFVVHGRRFAQRFPNLKGFGAPVALWLLDEPYEVDDTSQWSNRFDYVFVNDMATLDRHPRSLYLPVCYDPHVHYASEGLWTRSVGFIGGGNATRDRYLAALNNAGYLDYVVGGSWDDVGVQMRCLSPNITPRQTAMLYRQTRIVLNVFRATHHFNARNTEATSMNPRIYEALACGALVVSEARSEIASAIPELPTFTSEAECVSIVRDLLAHSERAEIIRRACVERIRHHTYTDRLRAVLANVEHRPMVTA